MRFDLLTLFPQMFDSYLSQSLLSAAIEQQLVKVHCWNFREWTTDRHQSVDDRPYGGGPGMLISCQPVFDCVDHLLECDPTPPQMVMMTPQGTPLTQSLVEELSTQKRFVVLCGRYEGFDDRVNQGLKPLEISVGDYITNGGEVPAMIFIETLIRLIPGVIGKQESHELDSFSDQGLLEHPQYTRPREYKGMQVPDVLLSGNHEQIARWRLEQQKQRTAERRPDLWQKYLDQNNS